MTAAFAPKGVQQPHPPIIVGGAGGPRIAALVSRWADEFDTVGVGPSEAGERIGACAIASTPMDAIAGHADHVGHDVVLRRRDRGRGAPALIQTARDTGDARRRFEDELEELRATCVVGSAEQAAERISEYAAKRGRRGSC